MPGPGPSQAEHLSKADLFPMLQSSNVKHSLLMFLDWLQMQNLIKKMEPLCN